MVEKLIISPPFVATAIRGILGYVLKNNNKTAFDILFAKSENGAKLKPYSIAVAEKQQLAYMPKDNFYFDITFFGDIIKKINLKTFIDFENYPIGKQNGKMKFVKAESITANSITTIFKLSSAKKFDSGKVIDKNIKDKTRLTIKFISPVCIQKVNSPQNITFSNIIKRIYERLLNLNLIDGETFISPNFTETENIICTQSNFIRYDVKHHSRIRKQFIYYKPAFIGSAEYYGYFEPFIKLLEIGEQIQIGRGTTSGLGKFRLHVGI